MNEPRISTRRGCCPYFAEVGPDEPNLEEWERRLSRPPLNSKSCLSLHDLSLRGLSVRDLSLRRDIVNSQEQSPFFLKLPAELRHMVYQYALAGNTIKLKFIGPEYEYYLIPEDAEHRNLLTLPWTYYLASVTCSESQIFYFWI